MQPCVILLVDDDRQALSELSEILGPYGHRLLTAASGAQALRQIDHDGSIAIVVSDIAMPDMGGFELARSLERRLQGSDSLQLIFCSGLSGSQIVLDALRHNAVDFVGKPVDKTVLLGAVNRAARRIATARRRHENLQEMIGQFRAMENLSRRIAGTAMKLDRMGPPEGDAGLPEPASIDAELGQAGETPPLSVGNTWLSTKIEMWIRVYGLVDGHFAKHGVEVDSWPIILEVMRAAVRRQGVPVTNLTISSSMPQTTALRRIDRLLKVGFLAKRDDPTDRRRSILVLTELGERFAKEIVEKLAAAGAG